MNKRTRRWLTLGLLGALIQMTLPAQAEQTIASTWKVQEVKYSYAGFTTAYDCDAAAQKIKSILKELGAHPSTKVTASGCNFNRPSRNFFVTIAAATPVPVSDATPPRSDESKQELLKRLGVKTDISTEQFASQWKTIDLANNNRLDLRPGDCELMEGLRDRVLPQLGMKVSERSLGCTPHSVGIATPTLTVSALVPTKSPDAKSIG